MNVDPTDEQLRFDEDYFKSGTYAEVSFEPYSQYWWSNQYYALLIRKFDHLRVEFWRWVVD